MDYALWLIPWASRGEATSVEATNGSLGHFKSCSDKGSLYSCLGKTGKTKSAHILNARCTSCKNSLLQCINHKSKDATEKIFEVGFFIHKHLAKLLTELLPCLHNHIAQDVIVLLRKVLLLFE